MLLLNFIAYQNEVLHVKSFRT